MADEEKDGRVSRTDEVFANLDSAFRAAAPGWGEFLASRVRETLIRQGFRPDSTLVQSVASTPATDNEDGLFVRVGPSVTYAIWVAKGRRAGTRPPPSEALLGWVTAVGLVDTGEDPQQVAFAVARSIGLKGIKARPFLQDTLRDNRDQLATRIREDVQKAATKAVQRQ